jgi:hypothetical protein
MHPISIISENRLQAKFSQFFYLSFYVFFSITTGLFADCWMHGKTVWTGEYGWRNSATDERMRNQNRKNISRELTRMFTNMTLAKLNNGTRDGAD